MNFLKRGKWSFFCFNWKLVVDLPELPEPRSSIRGHSQALQFPSQCIQFLGAESTSFLRHRQETLAAKALNYTHISKVVLCIFFLAGFWIWHGTKPQKRFGPRLRGEWVANPFHRFFKPLRAKNNRSPQRLLLTRAQGESNRSRCITLQAGCCFIDLAWFPDSRRVCGQRFPRLISTPDNQTQTSGTRRRLKFRRVEKQKLRRSFCWLKVQRGLCQPGAHCCTSSHSFSFSQSLRGTNRCLNRVSLEPVLVPHVLMYCMCWLFILMGQGGKSRLFSLNEKLSVRGCQDGWLDLSAVQAQSQRICLIPSFAEVAEVFTFTISRKVSTVLLKTLQ